LPGKYKTTLYSCYLGLITQAININLLPLFFVIFHEQYGLSFEVLGRLVFLNFVTQIAVDVLAVRYADRIGYRASAVLAHVFSFLGIVSLGILPLIMSNTLLALTISVFIIGCGGGIIEVVISPIVESLPTKEKSASMSLLHSFFCWGTVGVVIITTLLLWAVGTEIWFYLPICWAIIPLYNAVRFLRVPLLPLVPEGEEMPIRQLLRSPVFFLALIIMMCAGAAELTMSQWSSLFAELGLGVPKVVGDLVGPALFALLMGVGRTVYGRAGDRINLQKALQFSSLFCVVCYLAAVVFSAPLFSLLGAALCGLSVSLMWPGTLSMAAAQFPKGGTAMFGILAIFGNLGGSVGPWLTGVVSDLGQRSAWVQQWSTSRGFSIEQAGLRMGLLAAVIFPAIMFVGITVFQRKTAARRISSQLTS
jgi:MFS family permease